MSGGGEGSCAALCTLPCQNIAGLSTEDAQETLPPADVLLADEYQN